VWLRAGNASESDSHSGGDGDELIEAQNKLELTRVRNRWTRYDLIVIASWHVVMPDARRDCYLGDRGSGRKSCRDCHSNLPFSEWTTKFPNTRLCKAMLTG